MFKKLFVYYFILLLISCAVSNETLELERQHKDVVVGETITLQTSQESLVKSVELYNDKYILVYKKEFNVINGNLILSRFLETIPKTDMSTSMLLYVIDDNNNVESSYDINVSPSITIKSICGSEECEGYTGNVIENVTNTLTINSFDAAFNKVIYNFFDLDGHTHVVEHSFDSITDIDEVQFKFKSVPSNITSYISLVKIQVYLDENFIAENIIPLKVVRPLEVKHYGNYELAEVYPPVPVTGCIIGAIGNNISYSESVSETRQNSASITFDKSWSDSFSQGLSQSVSEGLNISESISSDISSSFTESETNSETNSTSYSSSENTGFDFSTNDGETWSWSHDQTNSTNESSTDGTSSNIGVNGSVTTGVSGEGSLPFLAKASGKVEVTVGGNASWGTNNSTTTGTSNSTSTGYVSANSTNTGKSFSTNQSVSTGESLSGSYAFGTTSTSSISEGQTQSTGRVWNMTESIDSGRVVTTNDGESISETIVNSTSSTTTFSYSAYLPRGRAGVFYRQTSRYVKLSEIITYDINGFPASAGYISMNTWAWAPELVMGNSCETLPDPTFNNATCYIPPCGE